MSENQESNEIIICKKCGYKFIFTAVDKMYYEKKGFAKSPSKCRQCRFETRSESEGKQLFTFRCSRCGKISKSDVDPTGKQFICKDCHAESKINKSNEQKEGN